MRLFWLLWVAAAHPQPAWCLHIIHVRFAQLCSAHHCWPYPACLPTLCRISLLLLTRCNLPAPAPAGTTAQKRQPMP